MLFRNCRFACLARTAVYKSLNQLAQARAQTLAQMTVAWILRHETMTSVLVGASRVSQIEDNVATLENLDFTAEELQAIEDILL